MATPKKLWKTTIVIWTDSDPRNMEIEGLATEATSGDAYCSVQKSEQVNPSKDKDWDKGCEFFDNE